jgi:hypothetical protein
VLEWFYTLTVHKLIMTQNKHIEHPEDQILTGDLSVLDWFYEPESIISTKVDGAPAIVWGTNPESGKFFVCTKAAFNKQKIRLCYNQDDIFTHFGHQPGVAQILIFCLDFLPRTENVYQGDWIGFGSGLDTFKPQLITYKFPEPVRQDIIICPHTYYTGDKLPEMVAHPITNKFTSTKHVLFVQPHVELNPYREDLEDVCKFAKQMSTLCEFVSENKAKQIKKTINDCIREQRVVNEDEIAEKCDCDKNLIRLWKLVYSIKTDMFLFIHEMDQIECSINGEDSFHEGFVIINQFGTYKVVDREVFSYNNFVTPKNW